MEINNQADLKMAILNLERKNAVQKELLIEQFHATHDSLRPVNLIKNIVKDITGSPDLGTNIINSSIGLATGFISKKILIGRSSNFFKKILGNIIELGVANVVAKNSDGLKEKGASFFKNLFKKKEEVA
jgi:hypothetical protein